MKTQLIPLSSFLPRGQVELKTDNELNMTAKSAINILYSRTDSPIKSYIYLPDEYKLHIPFRIDMTVKIDSPALYLIIGRGHIGFATGVLDNRRITDIYGDDFKPNSHSFDNDLPMDKFVDISVIYGRKAMQVIADGEVRCFSKNDNYIKAKEIPEEFKDGLSFGIACDKRTKLTIKNITLTEYEDSEPAFQPYNEKELPPPAIAHIDKPDFDNCISLLPEDLKAEIKKHDELILSYKHLKFRRKIEGDCSCCRITYLSQYGFTYKLNISGTTMNHSMAWCVYNTKREQEKYGGYKKNDLTIETLNKLAEASPEFADEMFFRIKECVGCSGGYCINRSHYEYKGKKKTSCGVKASCGGLIQFKMFTSEFTEARQVLETIDNLLQNGNYRK
jgi:hypothetical protein